MTENPVLRGGPPSFDGEVAGARAGIYSFLAGVFCLYPTPGSLAAVRAMAEALGVDAGPVATIDGVRQDYVDLFVVPGPRYVAPYESVFRDRWLLPTLLKPGSNPGEASREIKGLLMGESTMAVRRCYQDAGVLPSEDLPDHIGNELRFMALLWAKRYREQPESQAVSAARRSFRDGHILKWIGDLRMKVAERERTGFYSAALGVAETLLRDEAEWDVACEERPSPPKPAAGASRRSRAAVRS